MKRATPLGPEEQRRLERIRSLSRLLDEAIRVPGTQFRVGLDGLLGLMPVAGDVVTGLFSAHIIREAARLGIPGKIVARMIANLLVDVVGGAVPIVGDVMDVLWKANRKNMALLDEWLENVETSRGPIIDV